MLTLCVGQDRYDCVGCLFRRVMLAYIACGSKKLWLLGVYGFSGFCGYIYYCGSGYIWFIDSISLQLYMLLLVFFIIAYIVSTLNYSYI